MPLYAWPVILLGLYGCHNINSPTQDSFQVAEALGGGSNEGFARAINSREFLFPQDHGPHPEFRNEWWYLTGNLKTAEGQAFGFQFTLFRIALHPDSPSSHSAWRTNQIWMGHVALSDLSTGKHIAFEHFARQGVG